MINRQNIRTRALSKALLNFRSADLWTEHVNFIHGFFVNNIKHTPHTRTFGNDLGSTGRDVVRILLCNTHDRGENTIKRALLRTQTNYSIELSVYSRSVTNLRKQTRTQSGDVVKYQLVILGFVTVAQDSCWYLATNWIIAFAYSQITLVGSCNCRWCWYYVFLHFITCEFLFFSPYWWF